jgi:hypothetical protein
MVGCPNCGTVDCAGLEEASLSAALGGWSFGTTGRRGAFAGDLSLTILFLC